MSKGHEVVPADKGYRIEPVTLAAGDNEESKKTMSEGRDMAPVAKEEGIVDLASGDSRIIFSTAVEKLNPDLTRLSDNNESKYTMSKGHEVVPADKGNRIEPVTLAAGDNEESKCRMSEGRDMAPVAKEEGIVDLASGDSDVIFSTAVEELNPDLIRLSDNEESKCRMSEGRDMAPVAKEEGIVDLASGGWDVIFSTAVEELNPHLIRLSGPSNHVVYIWMPFATQVGHASLLLNNGLYISWWPRSKKKTRLLKKEGKRCRSLRDDIIYEGLEPDYVFQIPSQRVPDYVKMIDYWKAWVERGHYSLMFKNCCSTVYNVLMNGGAPRSRTLLWRPETLRRYLVIFLGGGSGTRLYLNLPTTDHQYKGSHALYIWRPDSRTEGHASLLLDNDVYLSWNWNSNINRGTLDKSRQLDLGRIGREEDIILTFRPKYLDLCAMKRYCKHSVANADEMLFGVNSFCFCYLVLNSGGAPLRSKPFAWLSAESLEKYVRSVFEVV